jgi:hypothetical protein
MMSEQPLAEKWQRHCPIAGLILITPEQSKPNSRRRTMDDGYYCVVCGRYIKAVDGVVVHDDVPHPDMAFDDEEKPQ